MAKKKQAKKRPAPAVPAKPSAPPPKAAQAPSVRARFFPTTARVSDEIQTWADEQGVRVLAVIPVYTEDSHDD